MWPEIIVIASAVAVLLLDLFVNEKKRVLLGPLAAIGLAAAFAALIFLTPKEGAVLGGRFAMDAVAWWFKVIFIISGLVTVLVSIDLLDGRVGVRVRGIGSRGEYYSVLLFTISGMMYIASSRDLITLYVSLELATIPLFVLAAWRRDNAESGEAGLKYVLIGAMASAFILYGLGIIYGLTGTTDLNLLKQALTPSLALWLATAMIVAGVGFKLTVVPFHMWAADVYQGRRHRLRPIFRSRQNVPGLHSYFRYFSESSARLSQMAR